MAEQQFRIECDTISEVKAPVNALWRARTQRAVESSPISDRPLKSEQIRTMDLLKAACTVVNKDRGLLSAEQADAIVAAAKEIADGKHGDQFPIDVFQTGSDTSSNMNTNEVTAPIAEANGAKAHPNGYVNMDQSSNDTFPIATHVVATEAAVEDLIPGLKTLQESLAKKAKEWKTVAKSGRTYLTDAVPTTLDQEFSGHVRQIEADIERIETTPPRLGKLLIGDTAVGTGLNIPADFDAKVIEQLIKLTGVKKLKGAQNHFEAQANRDGLVEFFGAMRLAAVSLNKVANDIHWMGSGPLAGLAEIHLLNLQPGSSIMPDKINPILCKTAIQVIAQVTGNDIAVAFVGTNGASELSVFIPVMARSVLESARLLANTVHVFTKKLVDGTESNIECMKTLVESSSSIVTSLSSATGYKNVAKVARAALRGGKAIRQTVIDMGFVDSKKPTEEELDRRLDVLTMANTDRDQFFLNSKV